MNKFDDQDSRILLQKYEDKMTEDEKTLCSLVSIAFVSNERMDKEDVESWRFLQGKLNEWHDDGIGLP
tara:strand:- start:1787 stop:1990 length:204 start_codon:yes stop_codon:yes gene_type:complete